MDYPRKIIEDRFSKLDLDGRPVVVLPFVKDTSVVTDALQKLDECYDPSYSSMSQLNKMPVISKLLNDSNHCRRTPYSLEFRLCGEEGCELCKKIGRSPRTPNVEVNGRNIRDEVLRFNTLPVENKDDMDHFLSPADARKHIEDEKLTAEDLIKIIPTTANNDEEKKAMKAAREKDKGKDFNSTKWV
ncbi:hypothetical protein ACHAWF_008133 [Thalassiosira exigua]